MRYILASWKNRRGSDCFGDVCATSDDLDALKAYAVAKWPNCDEVECDDARQELEILDTEVWVIHMYSYPDAPGQHGVWAVIRLSVNRVGGEA